MRKRLLSEYDILRCALITGGSQGLGLDFPMPARGGEWT